VAGEETASSGIVLFARADQGACTSQNWGNIIFKEDNFIISDKNNRTNKNHIEGSVQWTSS